MSETLIIALISLGGVGLTALGSWAGVVFTNRVSAKAQRRAAEIEQSKVDAAAYNSAKEIWGALIDDLSKQVAEQRCDVRSLRDRVEELERGRAKDHDLIRRLMAYARQLIDMLIGAGITPPEPPTEMLSDPERL